MNQSLNGKVNVWVCASCEATNPLTATSCSCLRARPIKPSKSMPQIFKGMVFHFNGVIPRTLIHPSHNIEWRMAEAHGAICLEDFKTEKLTHLIYRPGYERSEKVRAAVVRCGIPCVTINWMLDSLLQSRMLQDQNYRLTMIPPQALPTSNGSVLQHHQHPYFVANKEDFMMPEDKARLAAQRSGGGSGAESFPSSTSDLTITHQTYKGMGDPPPKMIPVPTPTERKAADFWLTTSGNKRLFDGVVICFASVPEDLAVRTKSVLSRGGRVTQDPAQATTVLFTSQDKKSPTMIEAAVLRRDATAKAGQPSGPLLCTVQWALDCLWMDERIPPLGPYLASEKLHQTLLKKAERNRKEEE